MDNEQFKSLMMMLWWNNAISWLIFIVASVTLLSVWVDNIVFQIISFLLIGLFGTLYWMKWDAKIKKFLK